MELRGKLGRITELMQSFERLSRKPSSLENVALKLEPLNEAVTHCLKFPHQQRQAQRVANFLGNVMANPAQEETVQVVASMALQTMMNHIRPVEVFSVQAIRHTRKWAMGTPAQRVHGDALVKSLRVHSEAAELRKQHAERSATAKVIPSPDRHVKKSKIERMRQERRGGESTTVAPTEIGGKKGPRRLSDPKKPKPVV